MTVLRFGVVAFSVLAVVGCSTEANRNKPVSDATAVEHQAATATPTLTTIAVDGTYADWQQVLLNPLQVSVDGNGISGAGCYPTNPDRDCEGFTSQRDITRFAWTYDNTNVYTYLERPTSNATLTYSFIMDVNVNGVAEATDRVLQVTWKTGGQIVAVKLFVYAPASASGDSLTCPSAALCPSVTNPHAQVGFVDGYTMPGATGALLWSPPAPACAGSAAGDECGGDGIGTRFEVSVPWSQLGVTARSPIFWHVAASTNTSFNQAKDNLGGPDGKLGTFGVFGVDFTADLTGSMPSPGSKDYCHLVTNSGQFTDLYNLVGISSTGSTITFFSDVGGCVAGTQMAVDANGDGDFLDVGDSVTAAFDSNADGLPDTGNLSGGATRSIVIRLTAAAGLNGSSDQLIATAKSASRPTLVFDTVTDQTRIGLVTVSPDLSRSGTPGLTVNFGPYTIQNNEAVSDTFNLFVRSSHGYSISLYTNVANAPGTLIATDTNADGTWDTVTPNTGALAAAGSVSYWLRVTIAAAAPIGTLDSVTFTATSNTTANITSAALSTLRVLSGLTLGPSYTSPSSQLVSAAGTKVYLPHFAINSLGVANTVTLAQSGVAAGYTMSWWSDPNGDGNISDGAPITSLSLAAFGGTQYFVTQITIPASGTPSASAARTTGNGVSGSTAFADDNVAVGSLQTYSDSLYTQPTRYFPACSTIYAKGVGLTPVQTTNYQLRFSNPTPTIVQSANMPTNTTGEGTGSYTLVAADAPGNWRVQIYAGATQISDLNPVTVERSGTVSVSAPALAVSGQALSVSALIANTAAASLYANSSVTFVVTDPASAVLKTATVSAADLAAGSVSMVFAAWPSVSYGAYGNYTVTATWKTSCGSTIASGTAVIAYPPPAPTLLTPADGAIVNSTTPSLTGTGASGGTVNIYIDGVLAGTATGTSTFSYTTAALSQGAHTWYATQTINGVTGPASATRSFTVDSLAPVAPVVTSPANGSLVNTTTPTYTGTAEAGSTVTVRVGGVVACTTTATAGGTFSCIQGTALAQGTQTVNATATDSANNVSPVSATNTFTVDSVAPNAPVVVAPANGAFVNTTTPTYSGTAEPAATVSVRVDGVIACTAVASGAGAFSCVQAVAIGQGAHTVNATATDATGNTSAVSNTNSFTVDSLPPAAPVVVAPANGSVSGTRTPTYSGTAEAGTTVAVRVDGALVCSAVASGLGGWSCAQPTALANGAHSVNATATDAASNTSATSNTNTFTVVIVGPNAPIVVTPANNSFTNAVRPTYSGTSDPNNTITVSVDGSLACTAIATAAGNWSCAQATNLTPGVHGVNAIATDSASLVSAPSATNSFTVDVTAPAAPVLTAPANGSSINTSTPTYVGTAEAGSLVTVRVGVVIACTTTATAAGTFSCVQSPALTEGAHSANATATDAANNTSAVSNTNTFTVDTLTPAAPVLTTPVNASNLNTATPTYSGTAEAGSTVVVRVDGVIACTAVTAPAGTFGCVQSTPLGQGPHSAQAIATDAAGNASPASNTNTFTVDVTAPAAPVLTAPAAGATINTATPTYTGTAEAGSLVTVRVGVVIACTTTATAAGTFSCVQSPALAEGAHSANATATDAANNTSAVSNTNAFTVDTVNPGAPVVSAPAAASTLGTATPTYSGTAEAGSSVTVSVDSVAVCTTTALADGTFSCTPATPLTQGPHSVNAIATDVAGNASLVSNTNAFTVDTVSPIAPVLSAPANGAILATATPTYSGTAEAGSTVVVRVDGAVVCSVAASSAGVFTCTPATAIGEGTHAVQAIATDAAGNASPASNTNTFTVDVTAPAAPVLTAPANGSSINTATPTYVGTAEAGSLVTVRVGVVVACTTTATAAGTFSCVQSPALAEGAHSANVTATDGANNTSPASNTNNFTVDTVNPGAPVVSAPAAASTLGTATPTYSGTAEAGSSVTVSVDSVAVCTTTALADGTFSCTPATPLAQGPHSVNAIATDVAGNASLVSNTNAFTVDTVSPIAPVLSAPANGAILATATPTYSGTAEAGSTVVVRVDGAVVCSVAASSAGVFTCTPATAIGEGTHAVQAIATDAAGNASPASNTNTFTVDTVSPDTAIASGPQAVTRVTTASFTFTSPDSPVTFECHLDGAPFTACTSPSTFNGLSEGSHLFEVRAIDAAGNGDPTPASRTWVVDVTAPDTSLVSGPAAVTTSTSASFDFSSNEAGVTYECALDTAVYSACTDPVTFSGLSEGRHTVLVRATDSAGNVDATPLSVTWVVDSVAPETTIDSGPPAQSTSSAAVFTFSSTDSTATFECSVDGAAFAACTSSLTLNGLGSGSHTFLVRAKDPAGNVDPTPATQTWVIALPIDTTIVSGPPALSKTTSANFTFSSNTANVTYECSLDGAAFAACSNPLVLTGLTEGVHTLRARAKDASGAVDSSPALSSWRVDTVAPGAPVITSPTEGDKVGFNPPFITGTAEPGSTVTVIIDGAPAGTALVDAGGSWVFTPTNPLGMGMHTVSGTAQDPAGNTSGPSKPISFTIDPAALDTRIVSGPQGTSSSASATFDFESNRSAATFECKLDAAAYTACSDPSTFSNLADGPHTLSVRAKDGTQVDPTPASRSWSVNTSGIPAPVVTAPADQSTVGTATPQVRGTAPAGTTVTVVIDGVVIGTAVADATGHWAFSPPTALGAGSHTVEARILDAAGATLASSAINTFTVDLNALDTFIVSGPNPLSRSTSAAFDLASNVDPVTYECNFDGAGFTPCLDPATFASLTEGSHTVLVRAKNSAGSLDPTPASFTWVVDTVGPSTTVVLTPANGATLVTGLPTASGTAEPGAIIEVVVDGQQVGVTTADANGAWSLPLTGALADGTHTISATATDLAGNQGTPSSTNTFTVITGKLMVPTITSPTNGQIIGTATPTITGKAAPNSTVTVFVDGVAIGSTVANASGDWTLVVTEPLTDTMHAITASARLDPRQSDVSTVTLITVDTVAPETVIKSGPATTTTSSTADFELGSNETGVHFECSLDGGPFTACGASQHYADLAEGSHTLAVRAVDAAGNRDASPLTYQWSRIGQSIKHNQSLAGGGCGCSTVEPGTVLLALLGLWAARRRRARP